MKNKKQIPFIFLLLIILIDSYLLTQISIRFDIEKNNPWFLMIVFLGIMTPYIALLKRLGDFFTKKHPRVKQFIHFFLGYIWIIGVGMVIVNFFYPLG